MGQVKDGRLNSQEIAIIHLGCQNFTNDDSFLYYHGDSLKIGQGNAQIPTDKYKKNQKLQDEGKLIGKILLKIQIFGD